MKRASAEVEGWGVETLSSPRAFCIFEITLRAAEVQSL